MFLNKIDNIGKCSGMYGFFHEKCIGYFEGSSEDILNVFCLSKFAESKYKNWNLNLKLSLENKVILLNAPVYINY